MPSTSSGTGIMNGYNTVIELVEITEMMSENVPSTGSGIGILNGYNTVIVWSRNHQMNKIALQQAQCPKMLVEVNFTKIASISSIPTSNVILSGVEGYYLADLSSLRDKNVITRFYNSLANSNLAPLKTQEK